MTDGEQRHEPAHDDRAPGDTSTGPRPAGRDQSDSPMPSGAVVGEVGRLGADPGSADPAGDADLGAGAEQDPQASSAGAVDVDEDTEPAEGRKAERDG